MILDDIKKKLEEIDPLVYYGAVPPLTEEEKELSSAWNYIVFNRTSIKKSSNGTSYSKYFEVHVVRENFVPEDMDIEVREKMTSIAGMKDAGVDVTFDYITKPNTQEVVEMMTLTFVKARK